MSDKLKKFMDTLKNFGSQPKEVVNPDERYSWVVKMIENPTMIREFIEESDPNVLMDIPYFQPREDELGEITHKSKRESFNIPIDDNFIIHLQYYIEQGIRQDSGFLWVVGVAKIIDIHTQKSRFLFSYILEEDNQPHDLVKKLNTYYLDGTQECLEDLWLSKTEVARTILDITREYHRTTIDTAHIVNTSKTIKGLIGAMGCGLNKTDIFRIIKPYKIGNYL